MSSIDFIWGNLIFSILVGIFYFGFAQLKSFRFNRFILLILPLLSIAWFWYAGESPSSLLYIRNLPVYELGSSTIDRTVQEYNLWFILYLGISLTIGIYSFYKLYAKWSSGKKVNIIGGISIYLIEGENSFSFGRRLFLTQDDLHNELVISHELAHLNQLHWIDMVLVQFLTIICWCNPAVWFYRRLVQFNHEYLADEVAVELTGASKKEYMLLLLNKTFNTNHFSIEHYFSLNSLISNRIDMLNKTKQLQLGRILFGGILLIVSSFYLGACAKASSEGKSEEPTTEVVEEEIIIDDVYKKVDKMPEFEGGMEKLMGFLGDNLTYPEECKAEGVEGTVFVSFIVDEQGKVIVSRIKRGVHEAMDNEALRVVKMMPDWIPGEHENKKVKVEYNLPIRFKMNPPVAPPPPSEN